MHTSPGPYFVDGHLAFLRISVALVHENLRIFSIKDDSGRLGELIRQEWDVKRATKFGPGEKRLKSARKLIGKGCGWIRAWLRNKLETNVPDPLKIRIVNVPT